MFLGNYPCSVQGFVCSCYCLHWLWKGHTKVSIVSFHVRVWAKTGSPWQQLPHTITYGTLHNVIAQCNHVTNSNRQKGQPGELVSKVAFIHHKQW